MSLAVVVRPAPEEDDAPEDGEGLRSGRTFRLEGHGGAVTGVKFHPTEAYLASASFDRTALLWQTDGKDIPAIAKYKGHSSSLTALAFPSVDTLATASADGTACIFDLASCARLKVLRGHTSHINDIAASEAATQYLLATASNDRCVRIWDGRARRTSAAKLDHAYPVLSVSFGEVQHAIYAAGIDGVLYRWDTRTCAVTDKYGSGGMITGIRVSRDCTRIACNGENGCVLWDVRPFVQGSRKIHQLQGCTYSFEANLLRATWSPRDRAVAAASADGNVCVWDAQNGALIEQLGGHAGAVNDVDFHPIMPVLASGSADSCIVIGPVLGIR